VNTINFLSVAFPLGLLLGAIMNLVVLRTAWGRSHRRQGEEPFLLLVMGAFLYDICAFLSLFTILVYFNGDEVRSLTRIFDLGVLLGLVFIPSLLLQTALAFLKEGTVPHWVPPLIYLPVVTMTPVLTVFKADTGSLLPRMPSLLGPFSIWMSLVCSLTSYVAYQSSRKDRRTTTAQLTTAMSATLAAVAVIYLGTFALEAFRIKGIGPYLNLAGILAPNALSIGLALYVYRYPDVGDALQRGFYNMSLALLVLCLYFFGIREVAQQLGTLKLNWEVVEALLLVGLVWAFHPLRSLAQNLYDGVFLRQVLRYQETFRRMSRGLSEDYVPDVAFVLQQAAGVIQEALSAEHASIYLVAQSPDGPRVTQGHPYPPPRELKDLLDRIQPFGEGFIDRFELEDRVLAHLLDTLDADGLYPFFREGTLAGIIILGHRGVDRQLGREERELLAYVGHSLADAIHKNALVEQKVQLEREIARTERMSALGRLAAGVAHEIKNPLSTIKSIIDVMREEAGEEGSLHEDLDVVSEEISRLDDTVKNLLDFIRPDDRKDRLVSIESVIHGVLHILDYEARRNQVVIATRLGQRAHYVRGMAEELKSIFFNLVINAIEAMGKDGGTLTITTQEAEVAPGREGEPGARRVVVRVQDTGGGIPEKVQQNIFQPFITEGKEEGTGLGLAIVRQKVAALKGDIRFETSSAGTRFLVTLPVAGRAPGERRRESDGEAEVESLPPPQASSSPSPSPSPSPLPKPPTPKEKNDGGEEISVSLRGPRLRRIK
jgi:signal transduction histidine kinase